MHGVREVTRTEGYDETRAITLEVVDRLPDNDDELVRALVAYPRTDKARFTKPSET